MNTTAKIEAKDDYDYWRSLQSELDRKALDAIEYLDYRFRSSEISVQAYEVSLKALNIALRGLVDEEVTEAIDQECRRVERAAKIAPHYTIEQIKKRKQTGSES